MKKKAHRYIRIGNEKVEVDIAVYRSFNSLRKQQLTENRKYRAITEAMPNDEFASPYNLEDEVERKLLTEQLNNALKQLTDEEYHLIYELFYLGKSERALASELCISHTALGKRFDRIIEKLRLYMKI
ncbi:MAG: hypothetical protein VB092_08015 [Oscillospiraceae bacterium]|nr:hypothetical protein [Oscillospiraceae bacterium]